MITFNMHDENEKIKYKNLTFYTCTFYVSLFEKKMRLEIDEGHGYLRSKE